MSDAPIHHESLENGLELLLRPSQQAPVAAIQIWAKVGSADEGPEEAGLAHFHEHMLFKGTERRAVGEVAGEIEGVGGRVNAYTTFDVTVYHATLPSAQLEVGLDVLVDAVRFSVFDPEEIAREIDVVLEEIRRSEDSPGHVLGDAVFHTMYREHPYRHPILGTRESVASFDRSKVRRFFEHWYAPDNLVVVAAGDFEPRALAARVGEAFADARPVGAARYRRPEPEQRALRSAVLRRPFERASLEMGVVSTGFGHPDGPALDLLAFVLGEGDSSRLNRRVKEREGFVDRIDAGSYTPLDPGTFGVAADLDPVHGEDALESIALELERLRAEPVSEHELDKARTNFLASEHFERESVGGMASKLGGFHVLGGDWRLEARYMEAIRGATPEALHRVARAYLAPERLSVGVLLPEDAGVQLGEKQIADAVERGFARTRRALAAPTAQPARAGGTIHSYALSNGGRLHVLPRRDVPVVGVRAAFLGGLLSETEATSGISRFLTDTWLRGTRAHSAAGLAGAIEGLGADLDGFAGRNSLGLALDVTADCFAAATELLAEVLLEPAFDPEEIERERRDTLAALERREDRLGARCFDLFAWEHFRAHPYRLPVIGLEPAVRGLTREALLEHQARLVRAENLVVGVAGDVDPDTTAALVSARLADLEAGGFVAPAPAPEPLPEGIRTAELCKDRAQAHLLIGFRGLSVDDPDRFALEVVAQLLGGQGGRLFLELRDRRGLAYAVSAMNQEGVAPGLFAAYIATQPERLEDARRGVLEELERLLEGPPSDDELERARRYLVGNFSIDEQRNATHALHVTLDSLYGLGPEASHGYPAQVAAVTGEDVLRVARRVIDLERYTQAIVRP